MNFYNANDNFYYIIHPDHIEDYVGKLPKWAPKNPDPRPSPPDNPNPGPSPSPPSDDNDEI